MLGQNSEACETDVQRDRMSEAKKWILAIEQVRAQMISVIANVIRLGEFDMLWDSVFAEFGYLVKVLLLSRGVHIT